MNTIVLGYKTHQNGKGVGPETLVAGQGVSGHEQAKIIDNAKARGEFPDGITFLQMALVVPRMTAIATVKAKVESPKQTRKESK
jgi:hypothetical protein